MQNAKCKMQNWRINFTFCILHWALEPARADITGEQAIEDE
jgi:hypothetical protein